jgi:hypothetical protein
LSLFPFFLIAFAILGSVSAGAEERAAILDFVFRYFPRQLEFVTTELDALAQSRVQLGAVGSIVIVWAAMGVFGAVTSGVITPGACRSRTATSHKAVSFLMPPPRASCSPRVPVGAVQVRAPRVHRDGERPRPARDAEPASATPSRALRFVVD